MASRVIRPQAVGLLAPPVRDEYIDPGTLGSPVKRALVLNMNNIATPGTFLDSGSIGHTVTAFNGAVQSAGAKKFGAGGFACNRVTDPYIRMDDHAAWQFRDGGFQVSMWIYLNSIAHASQIPLVYGTFGADAFGVVIEAGGNLAWFYQNGGAPFQYPGRAIGALSATTWHHIQIIRSDGWISTIVDGKIVGAGPETFDYDFSGDPLYIGSDVALPGGNSSVDGNIDCVELHNGYINRGVIVEDGVTYLRNFPVPTVEP